MREGGRARVKTQLKLITVTGDGKGKCEIISQKAAGVLPVEQETNSGTRPCAARGSFHSICFAQMDLQTTCNYDNDSRANRT